VAATPDIVIVNRFTYRGNFEEWSNKYHFSGGTPANAAAWKALADAIVAAQAPALPSVVRNVRAYGHEAGNVGAVWSYDYLTPAETTPGSLSQGSGALAPGDCAAWLRWATANFVNGKRIYLRKYFHGAVTTSVSNGDTLLAAQKTALETYGAAWVTGFISSTYKIAGPLGAAGSSPQAGAFITTRTLKRRGKRQAA
jgi:hypothetical protein